MTAAEADLAAENARLRAELDAERQQRVETQQREAALAHVLRLIGETAGDPKRALAAVAEHATRFCGVERCGVFQRDGDVLRAIAHFGPPNDVGAPDTLPIHRDSINGRAVLECHTIHVVDAATAAEFPIAMAVSAQFGQHTSLIAPLVLRGSAIGSLSVVRLEVRPFTAEQIALLERFAAYAAVAIENARLFEEAQAKSREVEERNQELAEALEQQTATAEILSIISASPTDLQPVFTAVAERAQRLLGAATAVVMLRDGDGIRHVAEVGPTLSATLHEPVPRTEPLRGGPVAHALAEARTIHVHGAPAEIAAAYPWLAKRWRAANWERRTTLNVPLLHESVALGTIIVTRADGMPFNDRQIALLETFAAQVVIAMQNTRLFNELREALEQQTATAEILRVISTSLTDLEPVMQAIATSACRLCDADWFAIAFTDGEVTHLGDEWGWRTYPGRLERVTRRSFGGRAILDRTLVHVVGAVADWQDEYPDAVRLLNRAHPALAALALPMLRRGEPVGCIILFRGEARAYSESQIALLQTFADQAVIAIENARLVSELHQKNSELEALNRQLEAASQYKSAFLSSMSHELRTPLNAVIGYSEMLQEECEDAGHTDLIPDLEKINAAGKHLLSLISTVLDLAKIEAGKMDLVLEDFHVAKLLAEVEAVVPPLMSENGNQFLLLVEGKLGSMHSDQTKLRQALFNLLSNAAKFTDHGTITLKVKRQAEQGADLLTFAVRDTGIGLTAEQQAKLFSAFSQAEVGTSAKYGGTGLGLALSREFCRLLGGDISVESELGRGSTFTIVLAAVAPGAAAARSEC